MKNSARFVVGIDEAGRGPLAGPLYLGAVLVPVQSGLLSKKIKDSKKQSAKSREEIFSFLKTERNNKKLRFAIFSISAYRIDRFGLSETIKNAVNQILKKIEANPKTTTILLDGGLKASKKFKNQKTIIRGDEKYSIIALASIVAKVSRDKKMILYAKKYPKYKFEIHKGYGTVLHRKLIKKYGPSPIHRTSFLSHILTKYKL